MNFSKKILLTIISIPIFTTSCSQPHISSRIYPYSRKDLASYHLDTPDPLKVTISPTQVLIVDWILPLSSSYNNFDHSEIIAIIRYEDETEKKIQLPVKSNFGTQQIELDLFNPITGIQNKIKSYKILLFHNSEVVAESRHKLWEDKIIVDD